MENTNDRKDCCVLFTAVFYSKILSQFKVLSFTVTGRTVIIKKLRLYAAEIKK